MKVVLLFSLLFISGYCCANDKVPYVEARGICSPVECALPTPEAAKSIARARMEVRALILCREKGFQGVDREIAAYCTAYKNIDGYDAECFGAYWCKE